ncbi:MAG: hypothetical protein M9894_02155 [Planctomycetes bacterium]|nr:hypothetical protein [Planctomycetota bacterium]
MLQPRTLGGLVAALALALAAGLPAGAQDDEPPFLEGQDRVDCQEPPLRVERPSDSWMFINLEVMQRRAEQARQDVSGYRTLRARLWHGSTRSNIFVHATPDNVRRTSPPAAAELARPMAEGLVGALEGGKLEAQGATRVGAREGWMFEVHGRPRGRDENAGAIAIVRAVVYRPEDGHVFTFTLEGPAEKIAQLKRDFVKLLKKVRV